LIDSWQAASSWTPTAITDRCIDKESSNGGEKRSGEVRGNPSSSCLVRIRICGRNRFPFSAQIMTADLKSVAAVVVAAAAQANPHCNGYMQKQVITAYVQHRRERRPSRVSHLMTDQHVVSDSAAHATRYLSPMYAGRCGAVGRSNNAEGAGKRRQY